jgi:hypothetical protein
LNTDKPNKKIKKIKEKKVKIKKFNEKENKNNMPYNKKGNKNHNKKEELNEIENIPLDQYKKYLNALFNNNNQTDFFTYKISKNNTSQSDYYDPNKITNGEDYYNNLETNIKNRSDKKSKNKNNKNNGRNANNYYLNGSSNSTSIIKRQKKIIKGGKKLNLSQDYQDNHGSDNDSYERIINEYNKLNMNASTTAKKQKNLKRVKSCEDPDYLYLKKNKNKNKNNNKNNEFYKNENRSAYLFNGTKKKKSSELETLSTEKNSKYNKNMLTRNKSQKEPKESKEVKKALNYSSSHIGNNKINNSNYNINNTFSRDISFMTNNSLSLEELKNRLKDKLISVTQELQDELRIYDGPVDIDCISLKSPEETLNEITNDLITNGFKCTKRKEYLMKFNKEDHYFEVELVRIKGNLLYLLINKS